MNLFIISSPYHLLLALNKSNYSKTDYCILIDEENKLSNYKKVIENSFQKSWYVTFPKGRIDKYLQFNQISLIFKFKIRRIIDIVNSDSINEIYINNDHFFGCQILVNKIKCNSVSYIEDGASLYNQWTYRDSLLLNTYSKNKILIFLSKKFPKIIDKFFFLIRKYFYIFLFGDNVKQISFMGTAFNYKKMFALYPDFVRTDLKKKVLQFESSKDINLNFINLSKIFKLNNIKKDFKYVVFVLTRLSEDQNEKWIERLVLENSIPKKNILIKPHPLAIYDMNNIKENYMFASNDIPIELLSSIINISHIYGPPSTALYSIKFFNPAINVTCIIKNEKMRNSTLVKMLEKCDINLLSCY